MKKMENSFAVTGFVGKDASIHQFTTASVARFSLAISRNEKNGDENSRTSAFMNVEAWRKNENRFIRPSGQGSTPHSRGLLHARGMAGCRGSQAQPSDSRCHQVLRSCREGERS